MPFGVSERSRAADFPADLAADLAADFAADFAADSAADFAADFAAIFRRISRRILRRIFGGATPFLTSFGGCPKPTKRGVFENPQDFFPRQSP